MLLLPKVMMNLTFETYDCFLSNGNAGLWIVRTSIQYKTTYCWFHSSLCRVLDPDGSSIQCKRTSIYSISLQTVEVHSIQKPPIETICSELE